MSEQPHLHHSLINNRRCTRAMMVDTNQEMKPKTNRRRVSSAAVLAAQRGVPAGTYRVDADALRKARRGVPRGEYHVDAVREHLDSAETEFLFFGQTICPYCTRAERTLDAHGLTYTEVNLDHHEGLREAIVAETRHRTVPVVFDLRGDEPVFVGGSDHLLEYL